MKSHFGDIDPDFLKYIFKQAYAMGINRIGLYTIGEMFLCKELLTHIRNAKDIGFDYVYSDTNGALASKENLKGVIEAGLDSIKFSINAGKSETYKKIHGPNTFEIVIDNLRTCYELKQEINPNFRLMVSYVVTKENEDEVGLLKEIVAPYVDSFETHSILVRNDSINDPRRNLIPDDKNASYSIPCSIVFNRIHVTFDGYLTACCQDFNQDLLLADLKITPLKEAWVSSNAIKLREAHLNQKLDGLLCANCCSENYCSYKSLKVQILL
jgi:molybdenum cofactor biosynthesis enzyme MoaA